MYKFNEDKLLEEFRAYIDNTYEQHYSKNGKQTMESIIRDGHGTGFCMGNMQKYKDRYGEKGETPEEWRKDLIKIMHYNLFQLFIHDETYPSEETLVNSQLELDLPNPVATAAVDLDHAPSKASIDFVTVAEWNALRNPVRFR